MSIRPLFTSSAGVQHYWRDTDENGGEVISSYDCEAILDRNKAMANHNDGYSPTRELRRVASIPLILWLKWLNEEGFDCFDPAHEDRLKRKLNDPDYLYLRTAPGRL